MKVEGVKLQEQCEAWCSVCLTDGLFATAVLLNGNRRLAGLNEEMAGEGIEETKIQSRHKYSLEYYLRRLHSQLNSIPLVGGNFPAPLSSHGIVPGSYLSNVNPAPLHTSKILV